MRLKLLLATVAVAGLVAIPTLASADWWHDCYCYDPCAAYSYNYSSRTMAYTPMYDHYGNRVAYSYDRYGNPVAVAGYSSLNRHPSMRSRDNARIAEYNSIFGPSRVAGYSGYAFTPWMDGGTWVTVNGQRIWATPSDFTWQNNRWVWSASPNAMVVFEDPRYQVTVRDWTTPTFRTTTSFNPWIDGGTWATVNGQRVWVTADDFVWMNDRWVWADDNSAMIEFDDDRISVTSNDWINKDRFDLDPDLNLDRLEVDPDRFNLDL